MSLGTKMASLTVVVATTAFLLGPAEGADFRGNARSCRSTDVTRVTRTEVDRQFQADLTRPGATYEFDTRFGAIDRSKVWLKTNRGTVTLQALAQRLPPKMRALWRGQRFKIGAPRSFFKTGCMLERPRPVVNYSCLGIVCTCRGDEDCNNMFSDAGVCGEVAQCNLDDDTCFCFKWP